MIHSIEPRVHYIRIIGQNFYSLPIWTNQTDLVPEASWFEYSLTNRIRGRTISPENTEAARLDLFKFVLASAYDINKAQFGNVAGDLTFEPSRMLRFHGDASYNVVGEGLQAYTTDVTLNVPRVTTSVGTRYTRIPPVIIPYFVQIPGTWNPGNNLPSNLSTHFLQGTASVDLSPNLVAHAKTNWDIRTTSAVENRFGVDLKLDCWALSVEYIRRNPDRPGKNPDNEFRFSLSLLGLGNVVDTRVGGGATSSDPRFK